MQIQNLEYISKQKRKKPHIILHFQINTAALYHVKQAEQLSWLAEVLQAGQCELKPSKKRGYRRS